MWKAQTSQSCLAVLPTLCHTVYFPPQQWHPWDLPSKSTSPLLPAFSRSMSSTGFAHSKLHNGFVMHVNGGYEEPSAESSSLPVWKGVFKAKFPREKVTPSHYASPVPLNHYWIRRDSFTSWADPIGLVTFWFPPEHDISLCVTANASQLTSRVKDIVLIWGWQ